MRRSDQLTKLEDMAAKIAPAAIKFALEDDSGKGKKGGEHFDLVGRIIAKYAASILKHCNEQQESLDIVGRVPCEVCKKAIKNKNKSALMCSESCKNKKRRVRKLQREGMALTQISKTVHLSEETTRGLLDI